jgi:two-component system sensor histidine kinase/response regulator
VIPAHSGEQAFKRLATTTPDIILLDLLMPGMDGMEVCRRLKADARWSRVPVIFLSAADDKDLIVEAIECGGVDYVTKPFNKAELITRLRTHLALKKANDELRNLAEDKEELLGILTHDLANHLAGIQINTLVLQEQASELPPPCPTLVDNISKCTESMLTFVQQFLANQSAEYLQVRIEPMPIKPLLEKAAEKHAAMAAKKEITLELKLPKRSLVAMADAGALSQVIDNLLSNALKFSRNGSKVILGAGKNPMEWVHVFVRDQGPGFTEEDQEKMFRRYGRLSAKPTGGEPSTGLGLSIVKRLVDTMNGRIVVESETGKGTCITVRLPVAPAE